MLEEGGDGGGPKYSFVQNKVLKWRYHNYSIKLWIGISEILQ